MSSNGAKYEAVAAALREQITRGQRRPGQMLDSENELATVFDVSRATVRKALEQLQREGLVRSEKGRGSFVAAASPVSRFFSLSTFEEDMRRLGRVPSTEVLAAEVVDATATVATRLEVPRGTALIHLRRRRHADGEPVAVEDRLLPRELCPGLLDEDLVHTSVHWLLTAKHGVDLVRIEQSVEVRALTGDEAGELATEPGAPGHAVDRLTFTTGTGGTQVPAVWFRSVHRNDAYTP